MINDREFSWPRVLGVGDVMNTKKRIMNAVDQAEAMTMNISQAAFSIPSGTTYFFSLMAYPSICKFHSWHPSDIATIDSET